MNKYIGIWYSWGDIELPVKVPENEDAFDYMMEVALQEVKVSIAECEDTVTIWLKDIDHRNGSGVIVLNYHSDNEYCYYKLFDSEEKCQDFLDSMRKK
jgi:hypothetical protein